MTDPDDIEDEGAEFDYEPAIPMILSAENVAIPDADLLCRDSGASGAIAIRVTADLDVEYLDGETRVWLSASVPPGPRRNS